MNYSFNKGKSVKFLFLSVNKISITLLKFILLCCIFPSLLSSQEEIQEQSERKNNIMATFGYTHIPKGAEPESSESEGYFVPTIGIDYYRVLNDKWILGLMIDFELDHYIISREELNRNSATIIAVGGGYKIINHLPVFAGVGVEIEEHANLFVLRVGAEYAIHLSEHWILSPGFFFDWKENYDTYSLSIGLGYYF